MRNRSIRNYNNGGVVAPADKTRTVQDTVALNRKVPLSVRSYYDQGTVRDFDFNPKDIELAGKHDVDYLNYVYDKKYGKDLKRLLLSDKENAELDKLGYLQRKARVAGTQKYFLGGALATIGSALGKAAPILEQAAPYAMSAINSINNVRQTGKLRTSRNPTLVKYAPSQYKSNLGAISDRNEAAYSSFIGNENPGVGALNKNLAFATMLDANSKAGLQDAEARNRFNMVQDRTNLAVAQQNAGITNATQEANLARYNDKIVSETQAYNAGFQDLINVDANRRAGNMQQKEMMLNFLSTADNGTIERIARQYGYSVEDFLNIINNPNKRLKVSPKGSGYTSVPSPIKRRGVGYSKYTPNLPDKLPLINS